MNDYIMKHAQVLYGCATLAVASLLMACGGSDSPTTPPSSNVRTVKYEVTGTYTGALNIVYTGASGSPVIAEALTLPIQREITLPASVSVISFTGSTVPGRGGVAGQTGTIRIYSGGTIVKSDVATVLSTGLLQLPVLSHVLP